MDEEMMFSLSYEQMTQMPEEEIKQCDFRRDGTHYVWEVNKAHDILRFWYSLTALASRLQKKPPMIRRLKKGKNYSISYFETEAVWYCPVIIN